MLMSRRNPDKRAAPGGKFGIISGGRIAGGGGGGLSAGLRPTFDLKAYMKRKEQRDKVRVSKQIRTRKGGYGFVNIFLKVPIACLCSRAAAVQLWNSQNMV